MVLFARSMVLFARSTIFLAPLKLRGAESLTNFGREECFPAPAKVSFAPLQQIAGSAKVSGARPKVMFTAPMLAITPIHQFRASAE
jgi:hypothetical protein